MSSQGAFDDEETSREDHFSDDSNGNCECAEYEDTASSEDQLEKLGTALTKLVCTQDCPPRMIKSPSFKAVLKYLNPCVDFGKLESIKDGCLKFYERDEIRVRHKLRNMDGRVNLSAETLKNKDFDDFVSITANFIDENWKLKKWTLKCQILNMESAPDGVIMRCLEHWGIRDKVFTLSLKSFNCCDGEEAVGSVKDYLQERNQLQVSGKLFQVYCCDELLALMAQEALKGISNITFKLHYYISWGVTFPQWQMTNRRLKQAFQMHAVGEIDVNPLFKEYLLSPEEWEQVPEVTKLLDKLHSVAEILFRAKHPSPSLFLINLHLLHVTLIEQNATESHGFLYSIREKMLQKLEKYLENMFPILAVAAVMDPRCKMAYIEHLSTKTPPASNGNNLLSPSGILEIVCTLYDEYLSSNLQQEMSASDSSPSDYETWNYSSSEEDDLLVSSKKRKVDPAVSVETEAKHNDMGVNATITSHLQDYQEYVQVAKRNQLPRSELDLYLDEPVLAWNENFQLLKWWRTESPKCPTLSRLARDLLSIPFSVATSDDAYYTEDREVDERLLSSDPVLMNALKCTRDWNRNT